jgi:biotin operon repressor
MNRTQQKILDLFEKNNGKLPSFREIAKEVGVSSTNTVSYNIDQLRKNGYLDIALSPNGITNLSIKTILALDGKPGVYVALCAGKPFFIGSSTNIRKHLLESVIGVDWSPFPQVVDQTESVTIAFHIVPDEHERNDLKQHLSDFYRTKGITI